MRLRLLISLMQKNEFADQSLLMEWSREHPEDNFMQTTLVRNNHRLSNNIQERAGLLEAFLVLVVSILLFVFLGDIIGMAWRNQLWISILLLLAVELLPVHLANSAAMLWQDSYKGRRF